MGLILFYRGINNSEDRDQDRFSDLMAVLTQRTVLKLQYCIFCLNNLNCKSTNSFKTAEDIDKIPTYWWCKDYSNMGYFIQRVLCAADLLSARGKLYIVVWLNIWRWLVHHVKFIKRLFFRETSNKVSAFNPAKFEHNNKVCAINGWQLSNWHYDDTYFTISCCRYLHFWLWNHRHLLPFCIY
jgi:hypothetical protein